MEIHLLLGSKQTSQRLVHWGLATQVYRTFWGGCFVLKVKNVQGKSHMLGWELGFFFSKTSPLYNEGKKILDKLLILTYTVYGSTRPMVRSKFGKVSSWMGLQGIGRFAPFPFLLKSTQIYMKDTRCHKTTMIHLYFICMYIRIYIYVCIFIYIYCMYICLYPISLLDPYYGKFWASLPSSLSPKPVPAGLTVIVHCT